MLHISNNICTESLSKGVNSDEQLGNLTCLLSIHINCAIQFIEIT